MTHSPRPGALRTASLIATASLLLAGTALLLGGCRESLGAPGVGTSAQTTDALALLPADAQMMGMMNLRAASESGALAAVTGQAGLGMVSGDGSADFDAFVRMTGFDPDADLDRVYVAGTEGPGDGPGRMAFVAYGRFDRDRIEQYLAERPEADLTVAQVDGVPVYTMADDGGRRGGFALVNDQMVIAGDEATLTAMLGRLGTQRAAADADLQALLDRVAYPDGAWFVARGLADRTAGIPDSAPPSAQAMRAAEGMVLSMDFRTDGVPVTAFIRAQAGADTDDLADVVRGGLSATKVGLKDQPAVFDVVDQVAVEAERDGVQIEGFLTPAFLTSVHHEASAEAR